MKQPRLLVLPLFVILASISGCLNPADLGNIRIRFTLDDLSQPITINQAGSDVDEYLWQVRIDADGNPATGEAPEGFDLLFTLVYPTWLGAPPQTGRLEGLFPDFAWNMHTRYSVWDSGDADYTVVTDVSADSVNSYEFTVSGNTIEIYAYSDFFGPVAISPTFRSRFEASYYDPGIPGYRADDVSNTPIIVGNNSATDASGDLVPAGAAPFVDIVSAEIRILLP